MQCEYRKLHIKLEHMQRCEGIKEPKILWQIKINEAISWHIIGISADTLIPQYTFLQIITWCRFFLSVFFFFIYLFCTPFTNVKLRWLCEHRKSADERDTAGKCKWGDREKHHIYGIENKWWAYSIDCRMDGYYTICGRTMACNLISYYFLFTWGLLTTLAPAYFAVADSHMHEYMSIFLSFYFVKFIEYSCKRAPTFLCNCRRVHFWFRSPIPLIWILIPIVHNWTKWIWMVSPSPRSLCTLAISLSLSLYFTRIYLCMFHVQVMTAPICHFLVVKAEWEYY